jgi:hypothetical protein
MKIYGAGIAGLLAGCTFQSAEIIESRQKSESGHKALLRFRTPAVGDAVGIEFKKVRVHKGIWLDGKFVEPNIMVANLYSQKVIGRLADRSIWNIEPTDRYIAPLDFIEQLEERCASRIEWGRKIGWEDIAHTHKSIPIISTLPMNAMVEMASKITVGKKPDISFNYAPITVRRWTIPGADVYQTIYFPSPNVSLYRASITGNLLIAEYITPPLSKIDDGLDYPFWTAFGLSNGDMRQLEIANQRYGKIAPIDDTWRKKFIYQLSTQFNIFSLGRFATWRNLLLDDVIKDLGVLKKLMNSGIYERSVYSSM